MAIKRRIDPVLGAAALHEWNSTSGGTKAARSVRATAVRFALEELATRAEGNSVEVRVPPFGVTQCIPGPRHTRGTPPNVVEMSDETFLSLVTGKIHWEQALGEGAIQASGLRADLSAYLPLFE